MNGRVDLRVACPGGIIGTGALRTVAELSGAWGVDRLTIGHRQDLLVAGIPESYVARFRAAVAPLEVDRADATGHPNVTSSAAATGIMRGARWLDAGIIQSILAGIRLRPSFAVNVADPHQDLLPLTSGLLNFLAADEVDSWRIAIAADHHPRRGARAPGRHDRVTLPYLVPSEYVAEAVQAAEETVVDAGAESSHVSEDLAHAIRARLGTRLVQADGGQRLPPPEYGDYEGVHPMQSGSGYWIGMSAGTRPFRHRFLEQMCMRAAQQGIGAVFTTCWRSLVASGWIATATSCRVGSSVTAKLRPEVTMERRDRRAIMVPASSRASGSRSETCQCRAASAWRTRTPWRPSSIRHSGRCSCATFLSTRGRYGAIPSTQALYAPIAAPLRMSGCPWPVCAAVTRCAIARDSTGTIRAG